MLTGLLPALVEGRDRSTNPSSIIQVVIYVVKGTGITVQQEGKRRHQCWAKEAEVGLRSRGTLRFSTARTSSFP
jgi:hypothetical protein